MTVRLFSRSFACRIDLVLVLFALAEAEAAAAVVLLRASLRYCNRTPTDQMPWPFVRGVFVEVFFLFPHLPDHVIPIRP